MIFFINKYLPNFFKCYFVCGVATVCYFKTLTFATAELCNTSDECNKRNQ